MASASTVQFVSALFGLSSGLWFIDYIYSSFANIDCFSTVDHRKKS